MSGEKEYRPRLNIAKKLIRQLEGAANFMSISKAELIEKILKEWVEKHVIERKGSIVVKNVGAKVKK